jgi:hypothetical protein
MSTHSNGTYTASSLQLPLLRGRGTLNGFERDRIESVFTHVKGAQFGQGNAMASWVESLRRGLHAMDPTSADALRREFNDCRSSGERLKGFVDAVLTPLIEANLEGRPSHGWSAMPSGKARNQIGTGVIHTHGGGRLR